jgi:hypothetical protein
MSVPRITHELLKICSSPAKKAKQPTTAVHQIVSVAQMIVLYDLLVPAYVFLEGFGPHEESWMQHYEKWVARKRIVFINSLALHSSQERTRLNTPRLAEVFDKIDAPSLIPMTLDYLRSCRESASQTAEAGAVEEEIKVVDREDIDQDGNDPQEIVEGEDVQEVQKHSEPEASGTEESNTGREQAAGSETEELRTTEPEQTEDMDNLPDEETQQKKNERLSKEEEERKQKQYIPHEGAQQEENERPDPMDVQEAQQHSEPEASGTEESKTIREQAAGSEPEESDTEFESLQPLQSNLMSEEHESSGKKEETFEASIQALDFSQMSEGH